MKNKILLILLFLFSTNIFAYDKFVDPNPGDNDFGSQVIPLITGNVVITSPGYTSGNVYGAVYLFNGSTGDLISSFYGVMGNIYTSQITTLPNGDFIVVNQNWDPGSSFQCFGSVTYVNGKTGLNGIVDSTNSIVGTHPYDRIGSEGITVLTNGNYLINSPEWKEDGINSYGAVTFCKLNTMLHGKVSKENSYVGNKNFLLNNAFRIMVLKNSNFIIQSSDKNKSSLSCVKSITWGSGESGVIGTITESNSLIVGDSIDYGKELYINEVKNSNYIITSRYWNNKFHNALGAVTWCDGSKPTVGYIDSTNSLIGLNSISKITITKNGDYLICSFGWKKESNGQFGALTWCDGAQGKFGRISSENSLVGNSTTDKLGTDIRTLSDKSIGVISTIFSSVLKNSVSALTCFSDNYNIAGKINYTNCLLANRDNASIEIIDSNRIALASFTQWNGSTYNSYLTILSINNFLTGYVNEKNSLLIKDSQNFSLPMVNLLPNKNIVIYGHGGKGFVSLFRKDDSIIGQLDINKCIMSINANLQISKIQPLTNGKYLIVTSNSVTFCDNDEYLSGVIDETNSFIGGCKDVVVLKNNNYLIVNPNWASNAGAITFCKGDKPFLESVSKSNSLIGARQNDLLGLKTIPGPSGDKYVTTVFPLLNGNYIVHSQHFHNKKNYEVGAITWGSGETGVVGEINSQNSLTINDTISPLDCNLFEFPNGNCLVSSRESFSGRGAITWIDGNKGISGFIDETNSIIGSGNGDGIGDYLKPVLTNSPNESFYIVNRYFGHSSKKGRGCVTFGNNKTGFRGEISERNSLIAPYIDFHDANDNSINVVCSDTINKLIYIAFKTEDFVHVLGFDNKLEIIDTKPQTKEIKISPNPSSDYINVEFDLEDFASITLDVLSYDGRLIKSDYLGYRPDGKVNINKNIADLPTGNYILRVKYNDISTVKAFSVVR